jgi:hypothetical protein
LKRIVELLSLLLPGYLTFTEKINKCEESAFFTVPQVGEVKPFLRIGLLFEKL